MEILIALAVAGLGAVALARRARPALPAPAALDAEADIALAVARHEAKSRAQALAPLHILYGLLHDAQIAGAIADLGGDADRSLDRVLEALSRDATAGDLDQVIGYAIVHAHAVRRPASCVDLWAAAATDGTLRALVQPDMIDVLFVLVHGKPEPAFSHVAGLVDVVLHNDDFSTRDLVVEVLQEVFEHDQARATELMTKAHHEGTSIVGSFPAVTAGPQIAAARRRARDQGYPLWFEAVARA